MIKKVSIVLLIIFFTLVPMVFGFSNDLFKFDLPEGYGNLEYNNSFVFAKTDESGRGMIILAKEYPGLKKSVWSIEQSDMNRLVNILSGSSNVVKTEKRAKLGKEKAIRVIVEADGSYIEMYILASNKYVYGVMFAGKSVSDFENEDYKMIKKSFKLKDRTTNPIAIYIVIAIVAFGTKPLISFLKNRKEYSYNAPSTNNIDNLDYKNMTEDDFNKFN